MRILIGGVERVLDGILPILATNHEISLFTEIHQSGNFPFLDSIVSYTMKPSDDVWTFWSPVLQMLLRRRLKILAKEIKKWKPDVVLLCGSKANSLSNFFAKETESPTVTYLHSVWDVSRIRDPPTEFKYRVVRYYKMNFTPQGFDSADLRNVKLAICVSSYVEKATRAKFPYMKTTVVHNGVDHKRFHPTFEDEDYALCVSRFSPEKNLEMLPRALCTADYSVILYGAVANGVRTKSEYLQKLESYKCKNVNFEVHRDQDTLLHRLQKCSVFLHPSKNEAFPLSPLEAMACGKVVICHNSGGMPESVGQAGYLLGDTESEWRETVDDLMRSESLRKEWGKKAWEHSKLFTWEKTARGVEVALEDAIAR